MPKLDPKITAEIADWLNTPADKRDVAAGAKLLLSLNRNRALYNAITRRPAQLASKLEYELRKFLKIRLHNTSVSDMRSVESKVMPRVAATLGDTPAISSDNELPQGTVATGKRADHDSLPDSVRALWDDNVIRYRKILLLFNELKAMSDMQPCDRLEKLIILDETESAYRDAMAAYDAYSPDADSANGESSAQTDPEAAAIAARKNISKYRKALASLTPESEKYADLVDRLRKAAAVVRASGQDFNAATAADLKKYGID